MNLSMEAATVLSRRSTAMVRASVLCCSRVRIDASSHSFAFSADRSASHSAALSAAYDSARIASDEGMAGGVPLMVKEPCEWAASKGGDEFFRVSSAPLLRGRQCTCTPMPSGRGGGGSNSGGGGDGGEEDPRIAELREVNARIKTVVSFLKAKHTPRSVDNAIANVQPFLGDHTPAFVLHDSGSFEGTRHVGALLTMCDALEVKASMGKTDALTECTTLLERKVQLLRELYGV